MVDKMLSQNLLDILVCPACKGELQIADSGEELLCPACCLGFPVRNGIPVMLVDQATRRCDRR